VRWQPESRKIQMPPPASARCHVSPASGIHHHQTLHQEDVSCLSEKARTPSTRAAARRIQAVKASQSKIVGRSDLNQHPGPAAKAANTGPGWPDQWSARPGPRAAQPQQGSQGQQMQQGVVRRSHAAEHHTPEQQTAKQVTTCSPQTAARGGLERLLSALQTHNPPPPRKPGQMAKSPAQRSKVLLRKGASKGEPSPAFPAEAAGSCGKSQPESDSGSQLVVSKLRARRPQALPLHVVSTTAAR